MWGFFMLQKRAIIKKAVKSKTIVFALLLAVLSVAQGYLFLLPLEPREQMLVGIGVSVVVTLLRLVTNKPLGEK